MTDYRYKLETPKLTGRRQEKIRCPRCGRKSFVRYVDTYNNYSYVANEVGKCDHQNSCGYHYNPKEYFDDHAWLKEKVVHFHQPQPLPPPPPLQPLPMELVEQCHSSESIFWEWFTIDCAEKLKLNPANIVQVYVDYLIGADEHRNVIYWQIDEKMRLRTGHIMQYHKDGKRHNGYQNWVHAKMIKDGALPSNWQLYQCFFGQHLLPRRPEAQVCLVEAEKTAVVMAARQPEYIWMATGGCHGLNPEKLECLRGRRIMLFPDSGCYEKWQKAMQRTNLRNYIISDKLEQYPPNTDLVDVLLQA